MPQIRIKLSDLFGLAEGISICNGHYEESQRTNPNGRVTSVTPTPEFNRLRPYERNLDKLDEQSTLLWHIKKRHKRDQALQALAKEIRDTSQTLDLLITAIKTTTDADKLAELKEHFQAARDRNYALIDEGALKLFGDCGFGGAFSEAIQLHLLELFKKGKLKGPMICGTLR